MKLIIGGDVLENESIGKYIAAINRSTQSLMNSKLDGINIGSGQHDFLYIIINNEGINQKELSDRLKIGKSTTTKAVKKLMDSGYIKRERDINDKRNYQIFLTERGKYIAPLVKLTFEELVEVYTKGFTQEESTYINEMLKKILDNLSNAVNDMESDK